MGEFSVYHWLIVGVVLLLFFGPRRIPDLMKGMGEGIRILKDSVSGKSSDSGSTDQLKRS